jgi:type IV pilus assembly protein PilM
LAKQDELTSTERLLELIRDERAAEPSDGGPEGRPPAGPGFRDFLTGSLTLSKKTISAGVDLGHEDVKLVKVSRVSDRKIELLDFRRVPFDPEIPREHPSFPQFLRSVLLKFIGSHKAVELWGTIPSARVETRYLRIPKVPQKQIANSVYWTYQKHSAFNDKETVFDYEILGDAEEGGAKKIAVMAYTAPRAEVEGLRDLFFKAGFPLTGISIVPFALQTLMRSRRVRTHGAAVAGLYIGRDWSRIDIFADDTLVLSRGIKAGIRTMAEALQREIEENWFELSMAKSPTADPNRIRAIKLRLRQELEAAQNSLFIPIHRPASAEADEPPPAVKEERVFQMILPALERLVRQIERTIRHFSLNFDNARVEKTFISSGTRLHPRILDYIGDELGIPVEEINPFAPGEGFSSLAAAPESTPEQGSFAPAMGMALASNAWTPNFLYTHKDKGKASSARRINRGMLACFFALIVVCGGVAFWQEQQIRDRDRQKLALMNQLAGFDVRVDKNLILKMVDQIRSRSRSLQGIGNSYLGIAVLGEVANTTPANIRLMSVSAKFAKDEKAGSGAKPEASRKTLILDGVVFGERANLEADLAGYLMTLKNSPLFKQPTISKKALEMIDNQPVMRFTAQMDLV